MPDTLIASHALVDGLRIRKVSRLHSKQPRSLCRPCNPATCVYTSILLLPVHAHAAHTSGIKYMTYGA
eukprot:1157270-Pelagomonas_calceolata.AAC.7